MEFSGWIDLCWILDLFESWFCLMFGYYALRFG